MTDDEVRELARKRAEGAAWWQAASARQEQAALPDPAEQPQPLTAGQIAQLDDVAFAANREAMGIRTGGLFGESRVVRESAHSYGARDRGRGLPGPSSLRRDDDNEQEQYR